MSDISKKSKSTTAPWGPAQQPLLDAANLTNSTVSGQQGNLQNIAGNIRGYLPDLNARAFGAQPGIGNAVGYNNDVLGGKYLNAGNPYMQGMMNNTNQLVGNQVNTTFSNAGRTGSGNHEYALANGLANADNSLQYQNYSNERNAQSTAAGQMPSLAAGQYAGVIPAMSANDTAAQVPFTGLNNLGQVGSMFSPYSQTTAKKAPFDYYMQMAAAAAQAGAGSDPRIKKNIVKIGELPDGLGRYEWDYRQDMGLDLPTGRHRGVMADEVAKLRPWALGEPLPGGYMTVNYAALEGVHA